MNMGLIFSLVFVVVFITLVIILTTFAIKREKNIQLNGIEADSIVVRAESYDCGRKRNCYVKYIGDDNKEHEAYIGVDLPIGRKVRVKFLPEKYDYVIFVSQEFE